MSRAPRSATMAATPWGGGGVEKKKKGKKKGGGWGGRVRRVRRPAPLPSSPLSCLGHADAHVDQGVLGDGQHGAVRDDAPQAGQRRARRRAARGRRHQRRVPPASTNHLALPRRVIPHDDDRVDEGARDGHVARRQRAARDEGADLHDDAHPAPARVVGGDGLWGRGRRVGGSGAPPRPRLAASPPPHLVQRVPQQRLPPKPDVAVRVGHRAAQQRDVDSGGGAVVERVLAPDPHPGHPLHPPRPLAAAVRRVDKGAQTDGGDGAGAAGGDVAEHVGDDAEGEVVGGGQRPALDQRSELGAEPDPCVREAGDEAGRGQGARAAALAVADRRDQEQVDAARGPARVETTTQRQRQGFGVAATDESRQLKSGLGGVGVGLPRLLLPSTASSTHRYDIVVRHARRGFIRREQGGARRGVGACRMGADARPLWRQLGGQQRQPARGGAVAGERGHRETPSRGVRGGG